VSKKTRARHANRVGRNDLCPCGSGNKYKRCCDGGAQQAAYDDGPSLEALAERWGPEVYADALTAATSSGGVLLNRVIGRDFTSLLDPGGPLERLRIDPTQLLSALSELPEGGRAGEWAARLGAKLLTPNVLRQFMSVTASCAANPELPHVARVAAGAAALSCRMSSTGAEPSMTGVDAWLRWQVANLSPQQLQHLIAREVRSQGVDALRQPAGPSLRRLIADRTASSLTKRTPWLRANAEAQATMAVARSTAMLHDGSAPAFLTPMEHLRLLAILASSKGMNEELVERFADASTAPEFLDPLLDRLSAFSRDPARNARDREAYKHLFMALAVEPEQTLLTAMTVTDNAGMKLLPVDERTDTLIQHLFGKITSVDTLDALRAHLEQIGDAPGLTALALARMDLLAVPNR